MGFRERFFSPLVRDADPPLALSGLLGRSVPARAGTGSVSEGQRSLTRRFIQDSSWVANMVRRGGTIPSGEPRGFPFPPRLPLPLYPPTGENGSPRARRLLAAVAHAHRGVRVAGPTPGLWGIGE